MRFTQCIKNPSHQRLPHHTMRSQCVITSIVDEFHQMITLKQNQVFRNQNLLDVSLPMIILLTKHVFFWVDEISGSHHRLCMPSYTFTVFYHWTHMYNQKYWGFHPRGYLSLFATTRHKFSCSANSGTPLLSSLINHQGWCLMTSCTYTHESDVSVHIQYIMPLHMNSMSHM